MATPPVRKSFKRDFNEVEKSPDIDQKINASADELKKLIIRSYERFNKDMEELITLMNESISSSVTQLQGLMMIEIKKLIAEISKLREVNAEHVRTVDNISSAQLETSARLNELEQDKFNNRIEISGLNSVSMNSGKSAQEIATQVLGIYNVKNYKSAYKRHLTINSEQKSFLIVTFNTYEEKMEVLNKKKTADRGKKCTVYFNHSLTSLNRSLYMRARIVAKSANLRVAISHGRVFIRDSDGKFGMRIRTEKDLLELTIKVDSVAT